MNIEKILIKHWPNQKITPQPNEIVGAMVEFSDHALAKYSRFILDRYHSGYNDKGEECWVDSTGDPQTVDMMIAAFKSSRP